jgi:hypothetical protein
MSIFSQRAGFVAADFCPQIHKLVWGKCPTKKHAAINMEYL